MIHDRRQFLRGASAAPLSLVPLLARAQSYPARPVRLIVPYAPGGMTDTIGRLIAQRLSDRFRKQFHVENMPGGGGNIGTSRAARAAADGYSILVNDGTSFVINPILYRNAAYDPETDFAPIAVPVVTTQVLTVTPSLPAKTVQDLVMLIKANPGKYSYASAGVTSPSRFTSELFRTSLGLDLVHVPFNGAGPAVTSTIGGHTQIAFGSPASSVAQIRQGTLRALAVASTSRLSALPDVPTMKEAGFPEIECDSGIGFFVPTGTPSEIIRILNREIDGIVSLPDVKEQLAAFGFKSSPNTPQEAAVALKVEGAKWAKLIQTADIKAE
jgi:tripartite-type tricarboxylate transporter receptor subunit TctC